MISQIEQTFKRVLTVDVGDHTGWAFWDGHTEPEDYGQIDLDKHIEGLESQLGFMQTNFKYLLQNLKPTLCILEGVEIWTGDLRSMTAARRGNLSKLSYLVGMYMATCREAEVDCRIVLAREWKGQLKDAMVASRVLNLTGIEMKKKNQHTIDAIGMGLALQGMFYRTKTKLQRIKRYKIAQNKK